MWVGGSEMAKNETKAIKKRRTPKPGPSESGGSIKVISTTLGGLLDQGRITKEEHTYFASDLTVKGLIKEINDVITLLGGYKMAEAFKWCAARAHARPPAHATLACTPARPLTHARAPPQVDARPKPADVGLPQARLGDARQAGRHARRARARERLH